MKNIVKNTIFYVCAPVRLHTLRTNYPQWPNDGVNQQTTSTRH
jgi:hypothetical protein